jgi:hypothetical protein
LISLAETLPDIIINCASFLSKPYSIFRESIFEITSTNDSISTLFPKEILRFKKRWEIELDPHFTIKEIEVISEGIEYYNTKFIKSIKYLFNC